MLVDTLPPLLTRRSAAVFAGVSLRTIDRLISTGSLHVLRIGGSVRIDRDTFLRDIGATTRESTRTDRRAATREAHAAAAVMGVQA